MGYGLRCIDDTRCFGRILAVAALLSVSWQAAVPARADDGATPRPSASAPAAERVAGHAAASEKSYVVSYPVADILSEVRNQRHLDAAGARDFFNGRVKGPPVMQCDMAQKCRAHFDEPQWRDEDLVVVANQAGHAQISAMLAAFRKFGVAEYSINIRFVALPEEQARKAFSDSASSIPTANRDASSSSDAGSPVVSEIPQERHGAAMVRARTAVEANSPLRFRVLDRDSEMKLLKFVDSDRRGRRVQPNVLDAPMITTFSGQTASVSDIAHSQFVVGTTLLPSGKREPKTRDVSEGTSIHLRPIVDPKGDVRLEFAASFSRIEQVTTENLKIAPDSELALRIPKVSTVCIDGGVSLKPAQSLILGSVKGFAEARTVSLMDKWFGCWIRPEKCAVQPLDLIVLLRVEPFEPPNPVTARVSSVGSSVACRTSSVP